MYVEFLSPFISNIYLTDLYYFSYFCYSLHTAVYLFACLFIYLEKHLYF